MEPANEEARPPRMEHPQPQKQPQKQQKQEERQKAIPISLFNNITISPRNFPSNPTSTAATTSDDDDDNDESTAAAAATTTVEPSSLSLTHASDSDEEPPPWTMSPTSTPTTTSTSGVIPPYWQHYRNVSQASQTSLDAAPRRSLIRLEDHTEDPANDASKGLWARSVTIDDYIVVRGSKSGIGAYVVWICNIQTLEGGSMVVRMRYSEFDDLRSKLAAAFPHAKTALPQLPPKSAIFKFSPKFLETRRLGLAYFLNCVLLNPEFSGSPVLKEVLFNHIG
ncbi:hypothetical protein GX50_03744 [[Emmonsia] crescens]|uniref:Endosomal/vacuolar adapter protein YPT35 n=1 Tax=[Emmonsia] crescens TaxID=73230 RepID=A0A2B7ZKU8_9EURO|nr:hypothetical protein GX50_03744 [Emmonsia crescens]